MRFSEDFIEKVRESSNIADEISQYTQLTPKGGRLFGLCPFPDHNEKTPSFTVSEDKQVYYCFGCKKSGNVYTFLQALKGFSFPESIEYLANKAGIALPKVDSAQMDQDDKRRQLKNTYFKINEFTSLFFQKQLAQLADSHPFKEYCKRRGLTSEIINTFRIGVSTDNWDDLAKELNHKKAPLKLAENLGLIRERKKGEGHFDLFRSRLMFPIVSHTSQVIGFGGRVLSDEHPKYLNSPESPVFNKGKIFYGLNETAKYIRTEDEIIIVEGYMDLIALYAAGIKNVVATLGTALTRDHAKLIKRFTKNVIILFDGDSAGRTAAERSLPILLEAELMPRVCFLPNKQDPDDFINSNGVEALRSELKSAPDLFSALLSEAVQKNSGAADAISKIKILDQFGPVLGKMGDPRLRRLYVEQIAERLRVQPDWVIKGMAQEKKALQARTPKPAFEGELNKQEFQPPKPKKVSKIKLLKASKLELMFLNICLMSSDLMKKALDAEMEEFLQHQGVREIFSLMADKHRQMPNEFDSLTALLMDQVEPQNLLSWHLGEPLVSSGPDSLERMLVDCMKKIRELAIRMKTKELAAALKGGMSPEEQQKKLEQIMNMQRDKIALKRDSDL